MEGEIDSIEKNETWETVIPLLGYKTIGLKWVYKVEKNSYGDIVKYKKNVMFKCMPS